MAAVGLSVDETRDEIHAFELSKSIDITSVFTISCINSPQSVTVSGLVNELREFTEYLTSKHIFARLLKVQVGYHSPQMSHITLQYARMMGVLRPDSLSRETTMVSSVTGAVIDAREVCSPDYWVRNMVSTVDFLAAIQSCCNAGRDRVMKKLDGSHKGDMCVDVWLEIGPHSALQGPLKQIVQSCRPRARFVYTSALVRSTAALNSLLKSIGSLWVENVSVDMRRVISLTRCARTVFRIPPSLPAYPFDRSTIHWEESQANLDFRLREHPCHDLAGVRVGNLKSQAEAQWRFRTRVKSIPWTEDHKIQGSILYPAAGSIAMVIEATKQLLGHENLVFLDLRDIEFCAPIHVIPDHDTHIALHLSAKKLSQGAGLQYEFRAFTSTSGSRHETLVCTGSIRAHHNDKRADFDVGQHDLQELRSSYLHAKRECSDKIDATQLYDSTQLGWSGRVDRS
jgi:acyl transferase domain-containing protein